LEYPIGFAVNPIDLVVFINGRLTLDYEFIQETNSVKLRQRSLAPGDRVTFRIMKAL
jgi:hypothetical protein